MQDIRYVVEPSDPQRVSAVKDALEDGELVTVYYESGHALSGGTLARRNVSSRPFTSVEFRDFSPYNVTKEKPKFFASQEIHDAIGSDDSLFTWVANTYASGWLICDDGSGEVADFVHLENDGTVSVIHVKGASNSSIGRRVAVTRFEELVSQATKNLRLLEDETLFSALTSMFRNGRTVIFTSRS